MNATLQANETLVTQTCINCGMTWAQPKTFDEWRRKDGKTFYCPNGHAQVYRVGETEEQRKIRELERQLGWANDRVNTANRNREWAEKLAKGANIAAGKAKAKARRLMTRASAGVCPCCNRTFKQLAAHMKSKHPEQIEA